ncbi:MAG: FGGY-family carbohydrate kinase [Eubacterium sp.]|nr:FGGY-family carbohydrate kinase [Eubacterium sp.]
MNILAYDIGTTGIKTCLFSLEDGITPLGSENRGYGLYEVPGGGMEQDADEWWSAMCETTRALLEKTGISPLDINGISFCSQMQGLVLVDSEGEPVRRPMSYMDQRATAQIKKHLAYGPTIAGANVFRLLKCLKATGAVPSSVKDPVWKYKWVEENEPENFARVHKWLDVKEYIIARCTGRFVMTEDSAYATLLYDTHRKEFSEPLMKMFGVKKEHMPDIIRSTDEAGKLLHGPAEELGLAAGTSVFGGGGDASFIGLGAGCVRPGDTHIYCGTSGWVSTVVPSQMVDTRYMIAAITGADPNSYNYFAEMETAGKCLEWVKNHLALDEIGVYLDRKDITSSTGMEKTYISLYDYLTEVIKKAPAGSGGVIFTPWLHGNRCPFEDPDAAAMFFGITMNTGKTELIRSVIEGICYHLRWMLECQDRKTRTSDVIRFVGGGALSDSVCQILADVTGRTIETVDHPQDAGSVGAAVTAAVGLREISHLYDTGRLIKPTKVFRPNPGNRAVYDRCYAVFKELHASNARGFSALSAIRERTGL